MYLLWFCQSFITSQSCLLFQIGLNLSKLVHIGLKLVMFLFISIFSYLPITNCTNSQNIGKSELGLPLSFTGSGAPQLFLALKKIEINIRKKKGEKIKLSGYFDIFNRILKQATYVLFYQLFFAPSQHFSLSDKVLAKYLE